MVLALFPLLFLHPTGLRKVPAPPDSFIQIVRQADVDRVRAEIKKLNQAEPAK